MAYFLRLKPASGLAILRALLWNLLRIGDTLDKRNRVNKLSRDEHRQRCRELIRPFPIDYFLRTSLGYIAKW